MVWLNDEEGYRVLKIPSVQPIIPEKINKEIVVKQGNIVAKLPDKPAVDDYCTLYVAKETVARK